MKFGILYHANCTDGFTAQWAAQKGIMEQYSDVQAIVSLPVSYTEESINNCILQILAATVDILYIVDFSLTRDILAKIKDAAPMMEVVVLDHHKSAFEMYGYDMAEFAADSSFEIFEDRLHIKLDNSMSGAKLTWRYFFSDREFTPWLIEYVSDYDTWQFKHGDNTKYVNQYIRSQEMEERIWDRMLTSMESPSTREDILHIGKDMYLRYMEKCETIASTAIGVMIDTSVGLLVVCQHKYASQVGSILAKRCGTFGAILTFSRTDGAVMAKISLRSEGDTDVSKLAAYLGGGGHKGAAGVEMYRSKFLGHLEELDIAFLSVEDVCENE